MNVCTYVSIKVSMNLSRLLGQQWNSMEFTNQRLRNSGDEVEAKKSIFVLRKGKLN
jgi:hypothetical protein